MNLWSRSFLLWLIGTAQSQFGSALASIALSFLVLHQTGSAGKMALTMACSLLPNLLQPLAGAWVDRVNLKLPLIGSDVARGVLQLLVGGVALLSGHVPLWVVNTAAALTGLAGIFAQPAAGAAVPALVPKDDLASANGLIGSVSQGAWLLGTLGGGVLVSAFSPALAIVLDGLSFLVMALLLLFVKLPHKAVHSASATSLLADVRAGLRLMRCSRMLSFAPVMALFINMALAPVMVIAPKLMESLGAGAKGYGTFMALESVGMMAAGLGISALGPRLALRRSSAAGFFLLAVTYGVMWQLPTTPVLLGCSLLVGCGLGLLNIPFLTLIQQMVPQDFMGRVMSVLNMVSMLGMPLSLLVISPFVDQLPLPLWFGLGGAVMGLGGVCWIAIVLAEREIPVLTAD